MHITERWGVRSHVQVRLEEQLNPLDPAAKRARRIPFCGGSTTKKRKACSHGRQCSLRRGANPPPALPFSCDPTTDSTISDRYEQGFT